MSIRQYATAWTFLRQGQTPIEILLLTCTLVLFFPLSQAVGQIERERVVDAPEVEDVFRTFRIVKLQSAENIPAGEFNFSVMHSFGKVDRGAVDFWGLDVNANIRLDLEFGLTDFWSIGVGRSRFDKLYGVNSKVQLLRQTRDDSMPLTLAASGALGINSLRSSRIEAMQPDGDAGFTDRISYAGALIAARKFNDAFSLQLTPLISHFIQPDVSTLRAVRSGNRTQFGLGVGARYAFTSRQAATAEFTPILAGSSDERQPNMAVGYEIDTGGGHVFHMFFSAGQGLTHQHMLAGNRDRFWDGELRFGFNVNRLFWFDE